MSFAGDQLFASSSLVAKCMFCLLLRSAAKSLPSRRRMTSVSASRETFGGDSMTTGVSHVLPRSVERVVPPMPTSFVLSCVYKPSTQVPSGSWRTGAETYQSLKRLRGVDSHVLP